MDPIKATRPGAGNPNPFPTPTSRPAAPPPRRLRAATPLSRMSSAGSPPPARGGAEAHFLPSTLSSPSGDRVKQSPMATSTPRLWAPSPERVCGPRHACPCRGDSQSCPHSGDEVTPSHRFHGRRPGEPRSRFTESSSTFFACSNAMLVALLRACRRRVGKGGRREVMVVNGLLYLAARGDTDVNTATWSTAGRACRLETPKLYTILPPSLFT